MMLPEPVLLLAPSISRVDSGRIEPTLSAGVVARDDAWVLAEETTNLVENPSLEVDTYRWSAADATIERSGDHAYHGSYSLKAVATGTLPRPSTFFSLALGVQVTISAWVYHELGVDKVFAISGGGSTAEVGSVPSGVWTRISKTSTADAGGTNYFQFRMTSAAIGNVFYLDAVQIEQKPFATPYVDGSMPTGTWSGTAHASSSVRAAATISPPLESFGSLYVRHDDTSSTLIAPGTFGDGGTVAHTGGSLTISAGGADITTVSMVLAFERELTPPEVAQLDTMSLVAMQMLFAAGRTLPGYQSGANHMETRVYITDRNNQRRDLIDATEISVQPDWDIDRAGSKGQVDVTASRGVLEPGMWIAPYQVIVPETGDIIEQQKGHFRLGRPGSVFDDTVGYDGDHRHAQEAFGSDIVDDIAAVKLAESFSTPVSGHVMSDVHYLIKLATMGQIGPNLVANGGFESTVSPSDPRPTVWLRAGSPAAHELSTTTSIVAEGVNSGLFLFAAGAVAGDWVRARQEVAIPSGATLLMVSGIAYRGVGNHRCQIDYEWLNSSGAVIGAQGTINNGQRYQQWVRHLAVISPPADAVRLNVHVRVYATGTIATASSSRWDDIQVRTVTTLPLPDDRINLPRSSAVATTRIQTAAGDSIGYDAINADRLAAIGHHALFAQQDGRPTSIPLRDTATATPVRTYRRTDIRDYRIIGSVEMPASDGNVPNHFIAVKESFQEGAATMVANAYNDNPNDAFSTVNTGRVISDDPIMVQDAVNQAALQAVADNARDRHSAQEELHIWVLPDATLNVHDVVEIDDPTMPGVSGKWLVQYLRPGMRPDDPLMEIGLRRALTGGM